MTGSVLLPTAVLPAAGSPLGLELLTGGYIGVSRGAASAFVCSPGTGRESLSATPDRMGNGGRQLMRSGTPSVWVKSSDGELLRADTLVHLRCRDGVVEATSAGGWRVRLT